MTRKKDITYIILSFILMLICIKLDVHIIRVYIIGLTGIIIFWILIIKMALNEITIKKR